MPYQFLSFDRYLPFTEVYILATALGLVMSDQWGVCVDWIYWYTVILFYSESNKETGDIIIGKKIFVLLFFCLREAKI